MYATLGHELPTRGGWTFEPKYDGMRVLAEHRRAAGATDDAQRQGQAARSFPRWSRRCARSSRELGAPCRARRRGRRAQRRRSRGERAGGERVPAAAGPHASARTPTRSSRLAVEAPATLVVFDLLRDGRATLTERPWSERRDAPRSAVRRTPDDPATANRRSDTSARGATMLARARRAGWEGIIAKRTDARYQAGHAVRRLAQAQAPVPRRVRRRRIHRAAQVAALSRRAAAWRARRRGPLRLCRPHGRRLRLARDSARCARASRSIERRRRPSRTRHAPTSPRTGWRRRSSSR